MIRPRLLSAFRSELEKRALLKTKLQPHQERVVERMSQPDQPGLVVAHGLGSGKTLSSIAAQERLNIPSTVAVPAALQANYAKERKKHLKGKSAPAKIVSMQNIARKETPPTEQMMIVDEAHRARESGTKIQDVLAKNKAQKRMLLTGSPFYNHPADIAPLINIAAGSPVLPATRQGFADRYIAEEQVKPGLINRLRGIKPGIRETVNPRTKEELGGIFKKWVDYHPGTAENFPTVGREDVKVPMTPEQLQVYDTMLKRAPPWVSMKIHSRLPPSKQEAKNLNAFLSGTRQVSNTTGPFDVRGEDAPIQDPKLESAFEHLKKEFKGNPESKAVVYSNYLNAGLNPYRQRLQEANIPYGEFTGQMAKRKRDELVRQYNEGKIRALLLSSAGGEGLDLKGTRLIQMLEPHWNQEKLKQVEGRGVRFMSHADLPEEQRNVRIQNFLSTRPRSGLLERLHLRKPGGSVDEYLVQMAREKERLNNEFRNVMAQQQAKLEAERARV